MIFVTVGHQMPFDRLIRGVDDWAGARQRADVFAQIGDAQYIPRHVEYAGRIGPDEFRRRMTEADAVVAHAGMGSILTALELGVPILVMPRFGRLMETRNDHQVATAERFKAMGRIEVAMDESELPTALDRLTDLRRADRISSEASPELLDAVRGFIFGSGTPK
ncbi:MAG: glycosyltransferase [Planctomycetota bacterium]